MKERSDGIKTRNDYRNNKKLRRKDWARQKWRGNPAAEATLRSYGKWEPGQIKGDKDAMMGAK